MNKHQISSEFLSIDRVEEIISQDFKLELSADAVAKVVKCREYLDNKLANTTEVIYGINTGFGSLYSESISNDDLEKLQYNLVISHACGLGEEVPQEIVKIILLLKIQGLSYGHSAIALSTLERLVWMFNNDMLPVIYQQGSLGASGDLAPLANMSLALIGEGYVDYDGERILASEALASANLEPLVLRAKEGLALLNGTQFMSSYATWCLIEGLRYSDLADLVGAMSLEGYDGRMEPFQDNVHLVRGHGGQLATARAIRKNVAGSEIASQKKVHVQDPYSFRCMPQVHGASKDALAQARRVVEIEINSVTDNPTLFPDEDLIVSAGNFHGQPLALSLDFMCIALSELASISERRTYKLIGGQRGLPPFLVANPGLNSGFMIPQYAIASIVSQNKQLATPASVDTIDSSNGQEDHVSMGANAATKCYRITENLGKVLGVELFNAAQAVEFRRPLKSSESIENLIADFREEVAFVKDDVVMYAEMQKSIDFLNNL